MVGSRILEETEILGVSEEIDTNETITVTASGRVESVDDGTVVVSLDGFAGTYQTVEFADVSIRQ